MGISLKTHKLLWGQSGMRCAFRGCRKLLFVDATLTDDPSVVGEEAHIVARSPDGPRGVSGLAENERDMLQNLILLCSEHHKVIDDQFNTYTVEVLKQMKAEHEQWVRAHDPVDPGKQRDDLIYADYVDTFVRLADLSEWRNWTSFLFSSSGPELRHEAYKRMLDLNEYLFNRVWPRRYPELERSLKNFNLVLNHLLTVFKKMSMSHPESTDPDDMIWTEKIYQQRDGAYDDDNYYRLLKQYEFHIDLVEDLSFELTRAANYVLDMVRSHLFEGFFLKEGQLTTTRGDILGFDLHRPEHKDDEIKVLYPGLKAFMTAREGRDIHIGNGVSTMYDRPKID